MTIWIDAEAFVEALNRSSVWGWSTEQDETAHKWVFNTIEKFLNDTQPSTDGDLISRADAIRAICGTESEVAREAPYNAEWFSRLARRQGEIVNIIESLPSAESTGAMDEAIQKYIEDGYMQPIGEDLIRRQRAVKEIDSFCGETWTESEADFARGLGTALSIIESLPSAPDSRQRGEWVGCTGCEHYDQQQTALVCRDCKRYYRDMYEDGEV